jgi:putative acetyltransferase
MKIRPIQKTDNPQIAEVIRSVFIIDDYPKIGTAFADVQLDFMFETYSKPNSIYFVIEDNDKIIGGGGIAPLENGDDTFCELQKMYFLHEARGKGLGKEIIEMCLQKAKEFGFEKCYLETLPNMLQAQKLYSKLGFEYINSSLGNTGHSSCPVFMLKNL